MKNQEIFYVVYKYQYDEALFDVKLKHIFIWIQKLLREFQVIKFYVYLQIENLILISFYWNFALLLKVGLQRMVITA